MADPAKAQQQPQGGGLPMSPAQKMAVEQFANQQKPFGWLQEILQRVMGAAQPAAPAKGTPDTSTAKGKKSEVAPQQPAQAPGQVPGGMIAPGQAQTPGASNLANVVQPDAMNSLGMTPQTQGDFAWVVQAMQHAHDVGAMKSGGGDIVSALSSIFGGGSAQSGGSPPAAKG